MDRTALALANPTARSTVESRESRVGMEVSLDSQLSTLDFSTAGAANRDGQRFQGSR
jgi:hypothetical protein